MKALIVSLASLLAVVPLLRNEAPADYPSDQWRDLARYSTVVVRGTIVHPRIWVERPSKRGTRVVRDSGGGVSVSVAGMAAFEGRLIRVRVDSVIKPSRRVRAGSLIDIFMSRDLEFGWKAGDEFLFFLHDPPKLTGEDPLTGWMTLRGTTIRNPETGHEEPFTPDAAFSMASVSVFQPVSPSKQITADNGGEIDAIIHDVLIASDVTPPTISITAPTDGAMLRGDVQLEASADDNVGVAEVRFTVDGEPAGGPIAIPPFRALWTSAGARDGTHSIGGTALDTSGNAANATPVGVTIDNTPPQLAVVAEPSAMWPPTNKLVPVKVSLSVRDAIDAAPIVRLVSISVNEPAPPDDIADAALRTDDREFRLRASRLGTEIGRIYTITYEAIDRAGNRATATTTVEVRHDQGS